MENCGEKKDNLTALYKSYCSKTMGRTAACAPSLITIAGFTNLSQKNITGGPWLVRFQLSSAVPVVKPWEGQLSTCLGNFPMGPSI